MKTKIFLYLIILLAKSTLAQNIEINRVEATYGLTIKKTEIGLNISDGSNSFGTAINSSKAIIQTHNDNNLLFNTNNTSNNQISIYNNTFKIGPSVFSPEIFAINYGRLKFTGSKDAINASGIEFTNTTGTALRGFVGMADDGEHLGFWGYGNNTFNVRMNASTGFMGIGAINPLTRLHVNGNIKVLGLGSPLSETLLLGDNIGNFTSQSISNVYQISSLDFSYKSGTSELVDSGNFSLYFNTTTAGSPILTAPFNAPNGVTLKLLNFGFADNNSSYNLEGCLVRVNLDGSAATNLYCVTSAGFPSSNTPTSSNTAITGSPVLNYNNYNYLFRIRVLSNAGTVSPWPNSTLRFVRANFSYDYLNY